MVDLKGEITFQDVSFTYKGDEKPVLSHLNFKIQPGKQLPLPVVPALEKQQSSILPSVS